MPPAGMGRDVPEAHWTEELFLRHPDLFLAVHEHGWEHGEEQARDLEQVLARFDVPKDARILDAPCGIGRHAIRLARSGHRVLGVDLSPAYVNRAGELAEQEGVADRVAFRTGDLRRLGDAASEGEPPFDVAMNLWTSLGYYGEATDERILRNYADLVRPGGLFLLYIVNRDYVVRHFDPQGYEAFGDVVEIEERRLDLAASHMRNRWRFFRKDGEDLIHEATIHVDHRIYSLHELRALLERCGWRVAMTFGGYKMDAPSWDSPGLLVVGRK